MARRITYKYNGVWVRRKFDGKIGRISYFDREEKLFWIVWNTKKSMAASGHQATEIIRLNRKPKPWLLLL